MGEIEEIVLRLGSEIIMSPYGEVVNRVKTVTCRVFIHPSIHSLLHDKSAKSGIHDNSTPNPQSPFLFQRVLLLLLYSSSRQVSRPFIASAVILRSSSPIITFPITVFLIPLSPPPHETRGCIDSDSLDRGAVETSRAGDPTSRHMCDSVIIPKTHQFSQSSCISPDSREG